MASTINRLRKAMRVSDSKKEKRDEYVYNRRKKQSSEVTALMEDLNDYDRYNETGTLVGIIEGYSEIEESMITDIPDIKDSQDETEVSDSGQETEN